MVWPAFARPGALPAWPFPRVDPGIIRRNTGSRCIRVISRNTPAAEHDGFRQPGLDRRIDLNA
jgi:hypothetical protein